jgi:ketosteroid isomerase-like protein
MAVPAHEQIQELEGRLRSAMLTSALDELDALLADDLLFTDRLGALWGKQDDLTAHRSGVIRIGALSASQERILVLEGAAIVSVLLEISGIFAGQEASGAFRFTRVWAQAASGQWQVFVAQSTLVADVDGGGERLRADGSEEP